MRSIRIVSTIALAALPVMSSLAAQGQGLLASPESLGAPSWHWRMAIGAAAPGWPGEMLSGEAHGQRVTGVSLFGDYYFGIAPRHDSGGGLRVSGGLLWGSRLLWAGTPPLPSTRPGLAIARPWSTPSALAGEASDAGTLPYLGLGYSGSIGSGRFGFSADLGLVARSPGQAVRFGRMLGGSQSVDDLARELRLTPVLQLGVSYAF